MQSSRSLYGIIVILIIFLLGLSATVIYLLLSNNKLNQEISELQPSITLTPTPSIMPTATEEPVANDTEDIVTTPTLINLKLYFFNPKLLKDGMDEFTTVFPVVRETSRKDVLTYLIEQYIIGPTSSEKASGFVGYENTQMFDGESNCGNKDFIIKEIKNQKATIQFCKTVIGTGVGADARFMSAIKSIATQFKNIDTVILLDKEGNCLFDYSGENKCLL